MDDTHEIREQERDENEQKLSTEEMKLLVVLGRALADPSHHPRRVLKGSPGSHARSFHPCSGSSTAQGRPTTRP